MAEYKIVRDYRSERAYKEGLRDGFAHMKPYEKLMQEASLLNQVFFSVLLAHPLPWRVEWDWTHEVVARDGTIIAKCQD